MKKNILTITIGFITFFGFAQQYTFSHFTRPYDPIAGSLPLWNYESWSYLNNNTPKVANIGFNFQLWGLGYTQFICRNNGTVAFKRTDITGFNDKIAACFTRIQSRIDNGNLVSRIHF